MAGIARRAVFTGVGLITPVGSTPAAYWESLCAGRSGIRRISCVDPSELFSQIGGETPDFIPKKIISNKEHLKGLRLMARTVQMGLASSHLAFQNSGLELGKFDPERAGVEFGAGMIASELDDIGKGAQVSLEPSKDSVSLAVWGEKGLKEVPPLWMLKYLPNMPSCHTSITLDLRGPSNTITGSDAASLLALSEAYHILLRDGADLFFAGGAESKMNPLSLTRHNLFQELSRRNHEPETAVKPFDRDRDGSVLGEAAGCVVLEELSHAKARGARIDGELVGFASGVDCDRDGKGFALVIRRALKQAGIGPNDVDHVNAQGHGTVRGDRWEARAINDVFGTNTPVWSIKANIGASGAASSMVELIGSILALKHGQLPPTLNHVNPDPECPVWVHNRGLRPVTKPYAVKMSFTDAGQIAVAVIRKWEE
ncbi:beta-ketoacyl-[acyl-carrier-protein] synthase family protein [Zavarzinella formosa]|uniref:beta-ketoacyl-[acyl-carrier-protein] synthase family protein n=1 Tax=Zavarzinella formosa TaxID=360055 RepID=UPI00049645B0|nr:beta-ketoacyl-[acyl-carrier-protein] synthase family protein [Zavarzinella formosa]